MPMPPWMMKGKMDKKKMPMGKAQDEGNKMMKAAISRKLAKRGSKSKY